MIITLAPAHTRASLLVNKLVNHQQAHDERHLDATGDDGGDRRVDYGDNS